MSSTGTAGHESGWAAESLSRSLHTAVLSANGSWQVVMIAAVLVSHDPTPPQRAGLLLAHVAMVALSYATLRHQFPLPALIVLVYALIVTDWAVADSVNGVLSFATAWFADFSPLLPALLLRGRLSWVIGLGGVLGVPALMYVWHHDWLHTLVGPAVVTTGAIFLMVRRAIPLLASFARRVDDQLEATDAAQRETAAAQAASLEGAEKARLLHDTVINTLAALASGGGATRDQRLVRQRCARDAQTLTALLDGTAADEATLVQVLTETPLQVVRSGLDDDALDRAVAALPVRRQVALVGIVREAVQNVVKHAGTDQVHVAVDARADELVVTVRDHGTGFSGAVVPGRGVESSIFGRADEVGIEVELTSAPGAGTTVTASVPLAAATVETTDFLDVVNVLRDRAMWLWASGTAAIGVVLEVVNRSGRFTWAYGMVAVVALSTLLAWSMVRRYGSLRFIGTAVLVLAAPTAFTMALAGVDFARGDVILWQSIGAAAPLLVLYVQTRDRSRIPLLLATAGVVVASVVCTVVIAQDSPNAAAVIPVGTAPALGILAAGAQFLRTLGRVGERTSRAQREAAASRVELAEREAATQARGRWRLAGLRRCLDLLSGVADGSTDATSTTVRDACAEEETYLRQLILLDPNLVRMGGRFAAALSVAHERNVRLIVRTGDHDVESDDVAATLGDLLLLAVDASAPGTHLTVTLFVTRGRIRLGIVGSDLAARVARWQPPGGWQAHTQELGGTDVVEVIRTTPVEAEPEETDTRKVA